MYKVLSFSFIKGHEEEAFVSKRFIFRWIKNLFNNASPCATEVLYSSRVAFSLLIYVRYNIHHSYVTDGGNIGQRGVLRGVVRDVLGVIAAPRTGYELAQLLVVSATTRRRDKISKLKFNSALKRFSSNSDENRIALTCSPHKQPPLISVRIQF